MGDTEQVFKESLDLFKKIEDITDPGEIEFISEAEKEEGLTRKVKYSLMSNKRIRFSYAGNIFYVDLPSMISGREDIYNFLDSILQKLNHAVYPAHFVASPKKKKISQKEETPSGSEKAGKEAKAGAEQEAE